MITLVKQDYFKNKKLYNDIESQLRDALDLSIPITHVGSTAIPDMYGKNIIDILIGAQNLEQFEEITEILKRKGYVASQKSRDEIYQFFSSVATETTSGDVHIHLVISNTDRYREFIILKDYLLQNKNEALNYSNLKKEIVNNGITDRKEYKAIKSEYVTNLIARAKIWYNEESKEEHLWIKKNY